MLRTLLTTLTLVCVVPLAAWSQDEALRFERAVERIDELAQRMMEEDHTPGMAVALTNREGLLHLSTYGFADKEARAPVTAETLFGIGSIGKSFTAVATLELHDEGKLDFHAPVANYLPWFTVKSTAPITAHHLLTHTAGLPNMRMELMSSLYQVFWLTQAPIKFEPGKQYHYSSSGFDLLSTLIEALSHQTYGEFIQKRVLEPLGMTHSEPVFRNRMRPRLATSYESLYDDRPADPQDPLVESNWYEYGGGAGSIAATAPDLAAYVRMLLNRGAGPHGRVLSEESFRLLTQRAVPRGSNRYYGYGLEISDDGGHTVIGHGGGVQGFRSMITGDLDDGLGVVVLVNGPAHLDVAQFALKTMRSALHNRDLPALPPRDAPDNVPNAAEYAGTYSTPTGQRLSFRAEHDRLVLDYHGQSIVLERRAPDRFFCRHPDFPLFLLQFRRDKDVVSEVSYGPDWYTNQRYSGSRDFAYPSEWNAYPGHYRTATRHHINFRIVLRKGQLWMAGSGGDETLLVPQKDATFRVGNQPEWVTFGDVLNGKALRANYSGSDYHRDFTP